MRTGLALAVVAFMAAAAPAHADLIGQQVSGSLTFGAGTTNYFLVSSNFVPAGYGFGNRAGQPVTIGGGVEFGFQDNTNTDTADFSGNTLTIQNVTNERTLAFTMRFTPAVAGLFTSYALVSDALGGTLSLDSGVLTYSAPAFVGTGGRTAVYTIGSAAVVAAVPEPASLALLGAAVLGTAARRRRRG